MKFKVLSLINLLQNRLDQIGMYRIVTLALTGILLVSLGAGAVGLIAYSPLVQLIALFPALLLGLGLNVLVTKVLKIPGNHESAVITVLILFFMFIPQAGLLSNWPLWAAVIAAELSKFIIVYRKQHIFNAAAIGAVLVVVGVWLSNLSLGTTYTTDIFSWWVSNPILFLPVLILGTCVVMKIRRWSPVGWFVGVGLAVYLFESWQLGFELQSEFVTYFLSWPTLFLAFFMLTEPFTMPPTKKHQAFYGGLVGALSNTTIFASIFPMTPELALVIGNLAVYPFRIRRKLVLELVERRLIAESIYEFIFKKPDGFKFESGQYLEWMLPHKASDSRGTRRYFTIASAPTEPILRLALKVVEGGSSYKHELMNLKPCDNIIASQLAGDFLLPKNQDSKLGFIAGGIGVTPFSSHVQYMADKRLNFDTVLLYCVNKSTELAYQDLFKKAEDKIKFKLISVVANEDVSGPLESGYVTKGMLERRVPDYKERTWYLSGPPPMVNAYSKLLVESGVSRGQIVKDFFPGLA